MTHRCTDEGAPTNIASDDEEPCYDILAANKEAEEFVDLSLSESEVVEWMMDRDMHAFYEYGGTEFLLRLMGDEDEEAFFRALKEALDVEEGASRESRHKAYKRLSAQSKTRLANVYDIKLGARAWLKEVADWCDKHKGKYDLCGNESLCGRITRV